MRWIARLVVCFVAALLVRESRAEPTLSHSIPAAIEPGKTTQVVIHGDRFAAPLRVWTSFPAKVDIASVDAKRAEIAITVDTNAPLGPGGLMVATHDGPSEPITLLIDDLPTVIDNGTNHSVAAAQEVPSLCAIDGFSDGALFDYYRFTAQAGQRLAFDVHARRLQSTFDPVLRLLDERGVELFVVDDDPALGPDCRTSYTFSAAGTYLLELRDSKYSAGGRYRLRIGDFPLVNTPLPLAARAGETRSFAFCGIDAAEAQSAITIVPNDPLKRTVCIPAHFPGGKSSDWATLLVSEVSESVEAEPNDAPAEATKLAIPCGVSGRLERSHDQDWFEFVAAKGQVVRFAAAAQSLGSPTLLVMRFFNADGNKLAETPVNDADEWSFDFTIPADGIYRLQAEDLLHRGGPEFAYHISITLAGSFGLAIKNDKSVRDRLLIEETNGACGVDLQIARGGYDGPIELSLSGDAPGLQLLNPTIPAGAKETKVWITATDAWKTDRLASVRIAGRAAGDSCNVAAAQSVELLRTRTPHVPYPPEWRNGLVAFAGSPATEPFFAFQLPDQPIAFARPLGEASAALTLARKNAEFKDAVTVLPASLPPGFTADVKADKDQYQFVIKGPSEIAAGPLVARFHVFGELKQHGRMETVELPIQSFDPLTVTAQTSEVLQVGQSQKVKITLVRQGDDPQPVTLNWQNLPPGVTGDASISVAADQNEIETELRAAADATPGIIEGATVQAASKFGGKDFSVTSEPIRLELKSET